MKNKFKKEIIKDLVYILIGAIVAFLLSYLGIIDFIISIISIKILAIFIAGLFFTSVFTISPATVALAHLSQNTPSLEIALIGAIGAVCGDILLFVFLRDKVAKDVMSVMKPSAVRHFLKSFHLGFLKWLIPVTGALIIASPLPDEIGLALLGISKSNLKYIIPIAVVMNFIGIFAIASCAKIIQ